MILGLELGWNQLLVGVTQGTAYALLGIGLVLVYRSTRVVHFGYGEVGAFGGVLVAKLVLDGGWSWWAATTAAVLVGAAISAGWERLVVRRLSRSSRLVLLVGTIAIAQVMFAAQLAIPHVRNIAAYPVAFRFQRDVGSFVLRGDHLMLLAAAPTIAIALAWFLNRTLVGLAIRGAAENSDAVELAGVDVHRLSTIVWALAGALATLTVILLLPVRGLSFGGEAPILGPGLLLRALVVGVAGRMRSLPMVVAGGLVFGVAESALVANADGGTVELALFLALLGLLLFVGVAGNEAGAAALAGRVRELPARAATNPWIRRLPRIAVVAGLAVAVVLPLLESSSSRQFTFAKVVVFAIAGMSVTVITGWAGQLSLCQFTFVGLGAVVTAGLTTHGMSFHWAGVYAVALTTSVAIGVGFPALRLRGLLLAVSTLGFAQAATWVFTWKMWKTPGTSEVLVQRTKLGPLDLANQKTYYFFCLAVAVAVGVLLTNLRRTGIGRAIAAVRDNEPAASAATISPRGAKLMAFALAGAVAGIAGVLYGGLFVDLDPVAFRPDSSILVLTMTIIGGVGSVVGAVLGTLYVIGIPSLLDASNLVTALVSGFGVLVLILFLPGGLLSLVHRIRDGLLGLLVAVAEPGERLEEADEGEIAGTASLSDPLRVAVASRTTPAVPGAPALRCSGVRVRFGGLVANDDVHLEVGDGAVVGLIGTNGAGKSTLMNAVGGEVRVEAGRIELFGHEVTSWPSHERAQLGLGRVFQDARLFPELTIRECVMVALEARERSELVPSLLRLPPARRGERAKRAAADEIIDLTGLGAYADAFAGDLSTGTRRIVELACLIGGGGRLLLLDEPTAGVAQREVEAFGALILDVRRQLGASILLIEHDMPLVMSLSDRVVCMTAGRVIADGPPNAIREDAAVIAAYLGTDDRAITRSDLVAGATDA